MKALKKPTSRYYLCVAMLSDVWHKAPSPPPPFQEFISPDISENSQFQTECAVGDTASLEAQSDSVQWKEKYNPLST